MLKMTLHEDEKKQIEKLTYGKNFWKRFSEYFGEFSENTSIHGIKYMVGRQRSPVEKLWWFMTICISIYTCQKFISLNWNKWVENPVFLSFMQTPMHIRKIPFPAVTLCPEQKIGNHYNFSHFTEKSLEGNITLQEMQKLRDVTILCRDFYTSYNPHFEGLLNSFVSLDTFVEVAPMVETFTTLSTWKSSFFLNGKKLLTPILTEDGVCFSFNMLNRNELFRDVAYLPKGIFVNQNISQWNVDNNYNDGSNESVYPHRVHSTLEDFHLALLIPSNIDKYCSRSKAIKVYVHHPAEIPTKLIKYVTVDLNDVYNIWIKPEVTVSTNLENYPPSIRKCFYSYEHPLKFYKFYTAENCRMECFANLSLELCKCVPYYAPREEKTPICKFLSDISCCSEVRVDLLKSQFCDCLPVCNSVMYDMEPTSTKKNEASRVIIRFKNAEFLAIERKELFGNVDFWANCGGILGLFTGFSFLSLIEIVYYLTLRWMLGLCRRMQSLGQSLKSF